MLSRFCLITLILILFISCNDSERSDEKDYRLNIQFLSDEQVDFNDSSFVKIKLWGYSNRVADAPATNLQTKTAGISSLDDIFLIEFNEDDFQAIEYKAGTDEEFEFYISFYIDTDNDGQICSNDYRWNYDKTDMMFFNQTETGENDLNIYICPRDGDICFEF